MKLTDLHSSRIERLVAAALRDHLARHECGCDYCQEDDEDEDVVYENVDVRGVAKQILVSLKKLEDEMVPA